MIQRKFTYWTPILMIVVLGACRKSPSEREAAGNPSPEASPAIPRFILEPAFGQVIREIDLPETSLRFTPSTYPPVDGSTSTHPLAALIACAALELNPVWAGGAVALTIQPALSGPASPTGLSGTTAGASGAQFVLDFINHNGTHRAYERLLWEDDRPSWNTPSAEWPELILAAREPSDEEAALARAKGVELAVEPIARDAFVFVVHADNPIESLTLDQVRSIYRGEVTSWDQVGGASTPIQPYRRNATSGSEVMMQRLVMRGDRLTTGPIQDDDGRISGAGNLFSMGMVFDRVGVDPAAIAYSVYYYAQFMIPRRVFPMWESKILAIDGVEPNAASIRSGAYPLGAEVYMVTRADLAADSPAGRLRQWLLSDEGQAVVAASGYVPIR